LGIISGIRSRINKISTMKNKILNNEFRLKLNREFHRELNWELKVELK
jgi:hypothetical protein